MLHTALDVLMVVMIVLMGILIGHMSHPQFGVKEPPEHLPAAILEPQAEPITLMLYDRYGKLRHEINTHLSSAPDVYTYGNCTFEKVGEKDGVHTYQELGA